MSIRSVQSTNTLDNFRTTFNSLGTDVGDVSTLSTTAKTVVGAVNELVSSLGEVNSITLGSSSVSLGGTLSSIAGLTNISGSGTVNFTTDVQVNSVSVATKPFAIAYSIALG